MTATDQWPVLFFQWAYFSWLQMLWKLKQNLSKLIDFYIFYPETWEKTKSGQRRWREDASLWSPTFSLDFVQWVRWGGWCSQNKAARVEIKGGFHAFYTIWTLAIEEVLSSQQRRQSGNWRVGPPSTRGLNEVPWSHCSGPLNWSSFQFSMLGNSGASIHF